MLLLLPSVVVVVFAFVFVAVISAAALTLTLAIGKGRELSLSISRLHEALSFEQKRGCCEGREERIESEEIGRKKEKERVTKSFKVRSEFEWK